MIKSKVIIINDEKLHKDSEKYFKKICGFDRENDWNKKEMERAYDLRECYKSRFSPHCVISLYSSESMEEHRFCFDEIEITCEVLRNISKDKVEAVCVYAMCIPEIEEADKRDMLSQFYLDVWMTAYLDAGRDWLRLYLEKYITQNRGYPVFMTHAFGPGFYGMGMEEVPKLCKVVDGEKIQMSLHHGGMNPPKSNIGFLLAMKEEIFLEEKDCRHCLADQKNCIFCKNNTAL